MKPTTAYTIRPSTKLLESVEIEKKELRLRITKIVNNYLKKLAK